MVLRRTSFFLDRYDVEEVLKDNRLDAEMIAEDVKGLL